MRIHYVIGCYLGPRRSKENSDPFCHIKQHLRFLKKNKWLADKFTIVCNESNTSLDKKIPEIIKTYQMPMVMDLIYRENTGGSYAAWEQAVIKNLKGFDYHFLIEDDYRPVSPTFLQPFLQTFDDNTAYVCQLFTSVGCVANGKKHPAIANGLLSNEASRNVYQEYGKLFNLLNFKKDRPDLNHYDKIECNQVNFMDYYLEKGYKIKDIQYLCRNPHQCFSIGPVGLRFMGFGEKNPPIIAPDAFLLLHHKLN
jgi:hypothetical protein